MRVPGHVAEGRRSPFPQGVFIGALKEAKSAYEENETGALLLTFKEIGPADADSPEVNGRPKTQRVQIADTNLKGDVVALVDVVEFNDDVPLSIQRSATLLTQLALALGAASKAQNGDVDVDMDQFIQDLEGGVHADSDVLFEVKHREWTSKKSGKSGTDDSIVRFAAAAAQAEAPAPAPAPTPAPKLTGSRSRR